MADEKILFAADLDNKNFVQSAKQMRGELDNLAAPDRFSDVFSMLGKFGPLMGVITAAAAGAKVAFDAILETEKIERVNRQFTMLAGQVGLYGDKLAESLSVAVAGTKDMDDVLEVASRSMVALGDNAERLPEIFELSRKVVKLYGGDVLETFDTLSNAIARGQTRALANYGVIVDNNKAYRDFADSIGVSDKALTDMQKKQALQNASLNTAITAFKTVDVNANDFTTTVEKLKVSLGDLVEVFTVALGTRAKPAFQSFLETVTEGANWIGKKTGAFFGDTIESNGQFIEETKKEIADLQNTITGYERSLGSAANYLSEYREAVRKLANEKSALADAEAKYATQVAEQKAITDQALAAGKTGGSGDAETKEFERSKQNQVIIEQNAQQQILGLKQARIQAEMQIEGNVLAMDKLFAEQKLVIEQQLESQLNELRAQYVLGQLTGEAEYQTKKVELAKTANAQIAALAKDRENGELNALKNMADQNKDTVAGFADGWKYASAQSKKNMINFSSAGAFAFDTMKGSLMAGYDALASGSEDAGEAMKKFFIGAIADKAAAAGAAMVLESIWPPNPAAAAGGLALMALAGNLKRLAGGGGGSSVSAGVSAAASPSMPESSGSFGGYGSSMAPEPAGPERKRSVTVQIAGNYLDTDQSRRYLLEMIRSETDATDFTYTQIGGVR